MAAIQGQPTYHKSLRPGRSPRAGEVGRPAAVCLDEVDKRNSHDDIGDDGHTVVGVVLDPGAGDHVDHECRQSCNI